MSDPFRPDAVGPDPQGSGGDAAGELADFGLEADAFRTALAGHATDVGFRELDPSVLRMLAEVRAKQRGTAAADDLSLLTVAPVSNAFVEGISDAPLGSIAAPAVVAPVEPSDVLAGEGRAAVTPLRGRRRPVLAWLAAAAAVLVAVPLGAVVILPMFRAGSAMPVSSMAAAGGGEPASARQSAAGAAAGATPAANETASTDQNQSSPASTTAAASATRTVKLGGVSVDVPATWTTGTALGSDWCAYSTWPKEPFVGAESMARPTASVKCSGSIPGDRQVEHLEWAPAAGLKAGSVTRNGWVYTTRIVAKVALTYVHRPGVDAGRILDTARAG